jgi:preprotein translocase subunit SecE
MMHMISQANSFLKEVVGELKKVVWPTRPEVVGASVVVCLFALFFAVVLGAMDAGFGSLIKMIVSGGQ